MKLEIELLNLASLGENIWVIVITGGPCAGKTTSFARMKQWLSDRGWKVLVVPESATKLISGGISPADTEIDTLGFQQGILFDSLCQEQAFLSAALTYRKAGRRVVVLCDRGLMDGKAYCKPEEFDAMLELNGFTESEMCEQRYHAVMHLQTTARGAEEYYQLDNNAARTETPEQARALDLRTLESWQRHPHPRVIDNSTDFEGKLRRLFAEICGVIGDPVPVESERKYLIEAPDLKSIKGHHVTTDIVQTYLFCPVKGEERRVRARGNNGEWTYFYTVKGEISPGVRTEREKIITAGEYEALITLRDPHMTPIKKRRTTFFWKNQYFEVDVFQYPRSDLFLMEAEQTDISGQLELPPWIKVIKEVTGDKAYSNKVIAQVGLSL